MFSYGEMLTILAVEAQFSTPIASLQGPNALLWDRAESKVRGHSACAERFNRSPPNFKKKAANSAPVNIDNHALAVPRPQIRLGLVLNAFRHH